LRPNWARGLLAGLHLASGLDEPALVEQLNLARGRLVVRVREDASLEPGSIRGVTLGWVRLGDNFVEEEHLDPGVYPEAVVKTRRRRG